MKIMSLVGARPQYIKEAVLNHEFRKRGVEEILVSSGQHYDFNMSDIFFKSLNVKTPDYNLGVGSGKHGEMTGKIMIEFEKIVEKEKPDLVLVYGDTNTTLAGAIVAAKLRIRVAHVEAGIRMLPKDMPEEINRVLTDRISSLLFCPSEKAVENLSKEGITNGVHFTGDVMYDLFLQMKPTFKYELIGKLNLVEGNYIVATIHRDYNVDHKDKLEKILKSLNTINESVRVVFPLHPRTKKRIAEFCLEHLLKSITTTEPLGYLELMGLITKSQKVITDSGGLQKEAYFAGKQALVLMPDTGWSELIESGCNILCDENDIGEKVFAKLKVQYKPNIYGEGNSGKKITDLVLNEK